MVQLDDASWQIGGCVLVKLPEESAEDGVDFSRLHAVPQRLQFRRQDLSTGGRR